MPQTEKTAAPIAPKSAEPVADAPLDAEEYERLLDMYDVSFKNFAEGEVVRGIVLQVSESEVIVDVGYKSEGIIQVDEFLDENGEVTVQPGDIGMGHVDHHRRCP